MNNKDFFSIMKKNKVNKDFIDAIDNFGENCFILWNKTKNIAFEMAYKADNLSLDGYRNEIENNDKIYILDTKKNKLILLK